MKGTDPSTTATKDLKMHCLCCQKEFHRENALATHMIPCDIDKHEDWAIVCVQLPGEEWAKTNPAWFYAKDHSAVYQCSRSPPMLDLFSNGHVVSSQDVQTKYTLINLLSPLHTTLKDREIEIPLDDRRKHSKGTSWCRSCCVPGQETHLHGNAWP